MPATQTTRLYLIEGGWGGEATVVFDADDRPVRWGIEVDGMTDVSRTERLDEVAEAIRSGDWQLI